MDEGDSKTIEHEGTTIALTFADGRIKANLTIGATTRKFSATQEDFSKAMNDTVSSPRNSFAAKVLAYYKSLSENEGKEYLDTKEDCPLRNFASWLLKTKARVTGEQIDKLTNKQLEEFVVMFCQTGDASGIKDVVDSTIELDAEKGKNSGNGFVDINAI